MIFTHVFLIRNPWSPELGDGQNDNQVWMASKLWNMVFLRTIYMYNAPVICMYCPPPPPIHGGEIKPRKKHLEGTSFSKKLNTALDIFSLFLFNFNLIPVPLLGNLHPADSVVYIRHTHLVCPSQYNDHGLWTEKDPDLQTTQAATGVRCTGWNKVGLRFLGILLLYIVDPLSPVLWHLQKEFLSLNKCSLLC